MKRRRGQYLLLLGLILGLGSGIAILLTQKWIAGELLDVLNDEVQASCDCKLEVDSIAVSLLTLSGTAERPRITEKGVPKLEFEKVKAKFSISEILQRKIILSKLDLFKGHAEGVSADSATFKFIDRLTAPIPPEHDSPNRLHVVLDELEVFPSSFVEHFGTSDLEASGVTLFVRRIGEQFVLTPRIQSLAYKILPSPDSPQGSLLPLGVVNSSVVLGDRITHINSLSVTGKDAQLNAKAEADTDNDNAMSGKHNFTFPLSYIGIPEWLSGTIAGNGSVGGSLGSPLLLASVTNPNQLPTNLSLGQTVLLSLNSLQSEVIVDVNHGKPIVTLSSLSASREGAQITESKPFRLTPDSMEGEFSVNADSIVYGPFTFKDINAQVAIGGSLGAAKTSISSDIGDVLFASIPLGSAVSSIKVQDNKTEFSLTKAPGTQGQLNVNGLIDQPINRPPSLQQASVVINDLPVPAPDANSNSGGVALLIGNLNFSGPLDIPAIKGSGDLKLLFSSATDQTPFTASFSMEKGRIDLPISIGAGKKISFLFDLMGGESSINADLSEFPLERINKSLSCGKLSANAGYKFALGDPWKGNGQIKVNQLDIACDPYTLRLKSPSNIPINNGILNLGTLALTALGNDLSVAGSVSYLSGYSITSKGALALKTFAPMLPNLETLHGDVAVDLRIAGAISKPQVSGSILLSRGEFALPSPDVSAHDFSGKMLIDEKNVITTDLTGYMNGGPVTLKGTLNPFTFAESNFTTEFKGVTIEPIQNASVTLSGSLNLAQSAAQRPLLKGEISLDEGELNQNLDLNQLVLNSLMGYFLPARNAPVVSSNRPDMDLEIHLGAGRNLFARTPFFGAELNADLVVGGTLANPNISGTMQTLNGWLGVKDSRFEITSGQITFKPELRLPVVDIVGEGTLRDNLGENLLVIIEANGPITNPRITLSSDRGMSHEELLLLLTSSRNLYGRTLVNTVGSSYNTGEELLDDGLFSGFGAFFRRLTRIDSLSFEPAYSAYTGSIEPAVVAGKRISDRITLFGESLFGAITDSKAGVVYNITDRLKISGVAESVSTRRNTALGSDLTWTILAEQSKFVEYYFEGNSEIRKKDLLAAAKISELSRIKPSDLEAIKQSMLSLYHNRGYLGTELELTCSDDGTFCRTITAQIKEDKQLNVRSIRFLGDDVSKIVDLKVLPNADEHPPATDTLIHDLETALIKGLRSEGYLGARIDASYALVDPAQVDMNVKVDLRQPVSFIFKGNKVFSDTDFLDAMDIFRRKRPFGNNTIRLLVETAERMYQEAGYLYATVGYTEEEQAGRITYTINIDEAQKVSVGRIIFTGNQSLSEEEILTKMNKLDPTSAASTFTPRQVVPDTIASNTQALAAVFLDEGFPDVQVSYQLEPRNNDEVIDIHYTVVEGARVTGDRVTVTGIPKDISPPSAPNGTISIPALNRFTSVLIDSVRDSGYLSPALTVDFDDRTSNFAVAVEPGSPTTISAIKVEGLKAISAQTIIDKLPFKVGDVWEPAVINQTRRNLLKLGLFSRVEIIPTDGKLDSLSEAMSVRVAERALRTLEVGGGVNSELGAHFFGEAVDKSLFGDGKSLAFRLDTYVDQADNSLTFNQGFASLRYVDPALLDSNYFLAEELRFQRQDLSTQEFDQDRVSFNSSLYRQLDSGVAISLGHTILQDKLNDVTPGAVLDPEFDTGDVRLGFISSTVSLDRRDDPILPHQGFTFRLEPKLAESFFGSEANFASFTSRATMIVPFSQTFSRWSLGLSGGLGLAHPLAGDNEIPITQRFYLGGRTSVRGFRENSLGPKGAEGAVIGGDQMLYGSAQLQYLLVDSVSVHTFLDGGNVYLQDDHNFGESIRYSAGLGFRYLSPIGPIGIDIGHPLNEKSGEPSVRIHFSVGSSL